MLAAVGRIASCASWAFFDLVLDICAALPASPSLPYSCTITSRIWPIASCARLSESVRM